MVAFASRTFTLYHDDATESCRSPTIILTVSVFSLRRPNWGSTVAERAVAGSDLNGHTDATRQLGQTTQLAGLPGNAGSWSSRITLS